MTQTIIRTSAGSLLRNRKPSARKRINSVVWTIVMIAILVALLYPLGWLLSAAFKSSGELFTSTGFWPKEFTPSNFADAMEGAGGLSFWQLLGNSVALSGLCVIGNVFSCSLAGYALARLRFKAKGLFFGFTILTLMLPMHVVLIPQYIIFQQAGLIGSFLPLVLPKFLACDGFFVFLIIQFVRGIPKEFDEAATVDGAGPYRLLDHPSARPPGPHHDGDLLLHLELERLLRPDDLPERSGHLHAAAGPAPLR